MARSDFTDRILADAGRHAEDAVRARAEQLKHKLDDARAWIDLSGQVRRHPWPALGLALAAGALAGLGAGRRAQARARRTLGSTAMAMLGTIALHAVRELAIAQLGSTAKRWWLDHRDGDDNLDDPRAARDADEPFARY
jgi:uncharacterized membrane protein YdfJ with MMPL/SSD domain